MELSVPKHGAFRAYARTQPWLYDERAFGIGTIAGRTGYERDDACGMALYAVLEPAR